AARAAGFVQLSARQAQAILDMRLGRLTGLEREKLEAEYKELWELTDYLEGLLASEKKLMGAIVDELKAIRAEFADERRTEIVDAEGEILTEALIDEEDMVVTRTRLGYVKRTPLREYQAQGRGGRGITGAQSGGDDDFVADMFASSTHDHLLLFTSKGRAYYKKVFELPEGGRTSKGKPFVNVVELQDGEEVVAMLPLKEFSAERFVFLATANGTVKKTALDAFDKINVRGIKAINLDEGDTLVSAAITSKEHDVLLTSAKGFSVRFMDERVRPMGRTAGGVRGMTLTAGDRMVGMVAFERTSPATLVTVCERGYGKRTPLSDYPTKNRGGKGVIAIKATARNGKVAAVRVVSDEDHLILISDKGKIIRVRATDISTTGRAAQGVRMMRLDDGEQVAAIERLADPQDEAVIAEGAPIEAADDGDTVPMESADLPDDGDDGAEGEDEGADDEAPDDEPDDEPGEGNGEGN
ncbi:MAG: DNA gyrase subunit A, partial [Deltaproteobacteria bacterium]|nr:DNA gyrase subunit A [Kofleriaceae bacterium]